MENARMGIETVVLFPDANMPFPNGNKHRLESNGNMGTWEHGGAWEHFGNMGTWEHGNIFCSFPSWEHGDRSDGTSAHARQLSVERFHEGGHHLLTAWYSHTRLHRHEAPPVLRLRAESLRPLRHPHLHPADADRPCVRATQQFLLRIHGTRVVHAELVHAPV
jgi:hypothetical protein